MQSYQIPAKRNLGIIETARSKTSPQIPYLKYNFILNLFLTCSGSGNQFHIEIRNVLEHFF